MFSRSISRSRSLGGAAIALAVLVLCPAPARSFDSGSDGSDGAFSPVTDVQIDLSLAATATWNTPSPVPGQGVYDPDEWAVVFKYTTIDVPAGVTVTFLNHPSGAPVVWLASGDVNVEGTVDVSGGVSSNPGPGGFEGADGTTTEQGFGPGGGGVAGSNEIGGSYGTLGGAGAGTTYGHATMLPLIGGSGGGARGDAGSGGGAILVASTTLITLAGEILANGGDATEADGAGGSGGGIRVVSNSITGQGLVSHAGGLGLGNFSGNGGLGRIRVEAPIMTLPLTLGPTITWEQDTGLVFPDGATAPRLRIAAIDGEPFPSDPDAGIGTLDLTIGAEGNVDVLIHAWNVPASTTVTLFLQENDGGIRTAATSSPLDCSVGGGNPCTATASVLFADLLSTEVFLRANW